jgi:hypothetical protein
LSSGVAAWHRWAELYRRRVQQVRVDKVGAAAGLFLKWRGWRRDEQDARRARTFKGKYSWVVDDFCAHSAARAITAAKPVISLSASFRVATLPPCIGIGGAHSSQLVA